MYTLSKHASINRATPMISQRGAGRLLTCAAFTRLGKCIAVDFWQGLILPALPVEAPLEDIQELHSRSREVHDDVIKEQAPLWDLPIPLLFRKSCSQYMTHLLITSPGQEPGCRGVQMAPAIKAMALDAPKKVMIKEPMVLTSTGAAASESHRWTCARPSMWLHEARILDYFDSNIENISRAAPALSPCCLPLQFGTGAS